MTLEPTLPCSLPVVQAPMAGGPSTTALTLAVTAAGGFGYVAAGYLTPDALGAAIDAVRADGTRSFGVNVFAPGAGTADPAAIAGYATELQPLAQRLGVETGTPRWDDDHYAAKLGILAAARVHTVGITFGCPAPDEIALLHAAGIRVAVTVTGAAEAGQAVAAGADSLVVQGAEAGGHQGTFDEAQPNGTSLLDALGEVRAVTDLPVVAAGGITTRADAAAALAAGALAVQIGTALLCTPEAGTSTTHRRALLEHRFAGTEITRAFSGRWARGLANEFVTEHRGAPAGYPQVHHLTRPLRAAATKRGEMGVPNLWAGTGWESVSAAPAGEIVRAIAP